VNILKFSLMSATTSIFLLAASYSASLKLPESEKFWFPASVGRHYSSATGGSTQFGDIVNFQQKIDTQGGANLIRELDLETISMDVQIDHHQDPSVQTIDISVVSTQLEKDRPLLVDLSGTQVLRISTNEHSNRMSKNAFMIFNFSDERSQPKDTLFIRIPKNIERVHMRSVGGRLDLVAQPKTLHFQSQSGNLNLQEDLANNEIIHQLTVETVSGDLNGPAHFQNLKFNSVSGNIKLTKWSGKIESVASQTISGDFEIKLDSLTQMELMNATVGFESKSGHVKVNDQIQKSGQLKLGNGAASLSIVSVSGDFEIEVDAEADLE
jgi:DUF4097 and DUF4098 domain-containing protein YvlB